MGQKSAVDRLPKEYHAMVVALIAEKRLTQEDIVNRVNDEAGKQVISKSSMNRFIKRFNKEKAELKATSHTKSFERIAMALERIANSLEKMSEKQN
jgi:hypothetical protein